MRTEGENEPLRLLLCHPELVVTRLCCQHFAYWQNARLARRFLLFPKISLRCDFREPCFFRAVERVSETILSLSFRPRRAKPAAWRNLARCVSVTNAFSFMPSPFLRGKPCIEPSSEQLLRSMQDPSTDARDDKDQSKNALLPFRNSTFTIQKEILRRCAPQDDRGGRFAPPV